MGVWVGLGVWLRGGTELAWRLVDCPNRFHRAGNAPSSFSPKIRFFLDIQLYGSVRPDQKLPFMDEPLVSTGSLLSKVRR